MEQGNSGMTQNSHNASMLNMARNALLVAGHEMGADGDHWPVIKAAVHGLARAYDAMKIEEEVTRQLRTHMKAALDEYAQLLDDHGDELDLDQKRELETFVGNMRELYQARFEPVGIPVPATGGVANDDNPLLELMDLATGTEGMLPFARAAAIISTLDETIAVGEG